MGTGEAAPVSSTRCDHLRPRRRRRDEGGQPTFLQADELGFLTSTGTLWSWPGQNPGAYRDPTGRWGIAIGVGGQGALWGPGAGGSAGVVFNSDAAGSSWGVYGSGKGIFGLGLVASAGLEVTIFSKAETFEGGGVGILADLASFFRLGGAVGTSPSAGGVFFTGTAGVGKGALVALFGSYTGVKWFAGPRSAPAPASSSTSGTCP